MNECSPLKEGGAPEASSGRSRGQEGNGASGEDRGVERACLQDKAPRKGDKGFPHDMHRAETGQAGGKILQPERLRFLEIMEENHYEN